MAVALSCGVSSGCGGAQAASPAPVWRSLDEARALDLIRHTLIEQGSHPTTGRKVALARGGSLHADVAFGAPPYSIAFVSQAEADKLGPRLPPPPPGEELRILRPDDHMLVLVLYAQRYRYDVGPAHTTSLLVAERLLVKDVTDFIVHVRNSPEDEP